MKSVNLYWKRFESTNVLIGIIYRLGQCITYYPNTSNISNSIIDNAYLSFTPPRTSVKVNILLPVYILFLV